MNIILSPILHIISINGKISSLLKILLYLSFMFAFSKYLNTIIVWYKIIKIEIHKGI